MKRVCVFIGLMLCPLIIFAYYPIRLDTVRDIDGNIYNTVKIGDQEWMAENLKTTAYNDGTSIPEVTDPEEWRHLQTAAFSWYDNDIRNKHTYGALYNFYTIETGKLCPEGWHVPSNEEWRELIDYLAVIGYKGEEGGALKSEYGWYDNGNGTDDFGFAAFPGGSRDYSGIFYFFGYYGHWWSATENNPLYAWYWYIYYYHDNVYRNYLIKSNGFSVRCLKD